ncbi:MAG: YceI family protein [Stygiobacter sp.]
MKKIFLASFILVLSTTLTFAQTKWVIDKAHSKVQFSVSHLVITDVVGQFKKYDIKVETNGDDFTNAKIEFTADVNSINTENEGRDKHLKSDDFFNAEKFPQIKFIGKKMEKVGDGKFKLTGDFTIRDVTKPITLDVTFRGIVKDPWGNTKAGFKVKGVVSRFDYNLKWNTLMETGGAVVGKDVEITVDLELNKQK